MIAPIATIAGRASVRTTLLEVADGRRIGARLEVGRGSGRGGVEGPPCEHPGEVLAVLDAGVQVGLWVGVGGGLLGGVGDAGTAGDARPRHWWRAPASNPC